jgi:lipoyl(octanoyl) transferase
VPRWAWIRLSYNEAAVVMEVLMSVNEACQIGTKLQREDRQPVEWRIFDAPLDYERALVMMDDRVAAIAAGTAPEAVWLLEHPPLYTAGTSARPEDLLDPRFPVYAAGRGGQYTYHGPGQRVAYVMLDLTRRGRDIRCLVQGLEQWVIDTLAAHNITAGRREGRVGVWVRRPDRGPDREDKIAAIGVRVRKWITFHGIALNIAPDLSHYDGIVPCGISDQGITSFEDLGVLLSMSEVDSVLRRRFEGLFGPTERARTELAIPA